MRPFGVPSAQPSTQPSIQPSTQPNGQPSRQPSSQPTAQPTLKPSRQPSTQPSRQPSRQPRGQPSAQPSHAPTRPMVIPTVQPTNPTATPTCVPSKAPTVEWIAPVENVSEAQEVALVNSEVWSCGRGVGNGSQSCTVMDGASGEVLSRYALPWDEIVGMVENSDGGSVVISGRHSDAASGTELALCKVFPSHLDCGAKMFSDVTYTASSFISHTRQFALVGTYEANPVVSFADSALGTLQSFGYTAESMKVVKFEKIYSVPNFIGTFVVGTCVGTGVSQPNNVLFSWVRSYTGIQVATTLRPTSSNIVLSGESLIETVTMDAAQLDMFIAGALQLSDIAGTNAYIVRVNALYRNVLYGVRYRYARINARRALADTLSTFTSAVKDMALVDTTLYMLLHTVNSKERVVATILKANASTGAILRQAHIESINSSIICTNIVHTPTALAIGCTVQYAASRAQSTVISIDTALSFSKLPVGFVCFTDARFTAESVEFIASPLPVVASSVFLRATPSALNSTRDSYTRAYPPTASPTDAPAFAPSSRPSAVPSSEPSSQPSSVPSSQPSSSPSAAPSVSPQPTGQPSTSGPTNTYKPSRKPTATPTRQPSVTPTVRPSIQRTSAPTARPTVQPTVQPTMQPSMVTSARPTLAPSRRPTPGLSTPRPSSPVPSVESAHHPSAAPTSESDSSRSDDTLSYVIGCSVVGSLLLAALCAWVYYTQTKQNTNTRKTTRITTETRRSSRFTLENLRKYLTHRIIQKVTILR